MVRHSWAQRPITRPSWWKGIASTAHYIRIYIYIHINIQYIKQKHEAPGFLRLFTRLQDFWHHSDVFHHHMTPTQTIAHVFPGISLKSTINWLLVWPSQDGQLNTSSNPLLCYVWDMWEAASNWRLFKSQARKNSLKKKKRSWTARPNETWKTWKTIPIGAIGNFLRANC